jgi:thiamine biosynthesis lipoprotein
VTARPAHRRAWVEQIMGMPISVHVRGPGIDDPEVGTAVEAVFADLRRVDETFSTYREHSEISRLRRGEIDLAACSSEVREVVALCRDARRRTGGAFDADLPTDEGTTSFDPTGLVKGWAAERAAWHLDALGGHSYSLNAGGDVVVGGRDDSGVPWRVGVERPSHPDQLVAVLEMSSGAVATSGRAQRGLHIIDPVTGVPASELLSVTVTGPSLLWADVLATAAFVHGQDAFDFMAGHDDYEAIIVDNGGAVSSTPGFGSPP